MSECHLINVNNGIISLILVITIVLIERFIVISLIYVVLLVTSVSLCILSAKHADIE